MHRLVSAGLTMVLGMLVGLGAGLLLTVWILIVYLRSGEAPFAAQRTTFAFTVILYLAGGIATGGLAGLLGPLARGPVWAAMVGFLSALPVALTLSHFGIRDVSHPVLVAVLTSLGLGIPIGLVYRRLFGDFFAAATEDGPAP